MKPRKPDRFERMVQRKFPRWRKFLKGDPMIGWGQAADLLRNEHAWMRRMVRAMSAIAEEMEMSKQGLMNLILEQLAQRRK